MKKLTTVFLFAIGLIFVSCQKEVIRPNNCDAEVHSNSQNDVYRSSSSTTSTGSGTPVGDKAVGEGDITDPNNDPDGNKKNSK